MKIDTTIELFDLISRGTENAESRRKSIQLRKEQLKKIESNQELTKVAFDTRRINQETDYIPRRNLQNYNRSEAFLSKATAQKIKKFAKLRFVLSELKQEFGREPEWQDSNARVLLSTLDKGLRLNQMDGDFSEVQPSVGSLNYIEQLLHVRYRLTLDDLESLGELELKKIILSKDEELVNQDVNQLLGFIKKNDAETSDLVVFDRGITRRKISSDSYDDLLDNLLNSKTKE